MSAQLKRRFAGGSTLVVIIPEFIRVLHKRPTIYSFTLEQGSHKNARTGSPRGAGTQEGQISLASGFCVYEAVSPLIYYFKMYRHTLRIF